MKILFGVLCLSGLLVGNLDAKTKPINWQQAKVAVEIDIKDLMEQVRMGVTIFGDYKSNEQITEYQLPNYVADHFEQTFNELGIQYKLVKRQKPNEAELSTLKKKAKRNLYKKINEDFMTGLQQEGFSDLMVVKFFPQIIRDHRLGIPKINGFGLYKIPGANCVYHTLGYFHHNLRAGGKSSMHPVVEEIPEKNKVDHVCLFGRNVKPIGIEWKKNSTDYSAYELNRIEKELKNLILKGILDTFQRQGILESQLIANQLYINLTQAEYLVVEKITSDQFTINEQPFNRNQLNQFLSQFVNQKDQDKILVGLKTKSKYTFGDLKELFIPVIKDTAIKMYRLGPEYELIEI